jgi:DNA-binding CsgD family transcriptional regulator
VREDGAAKIIAAIYEVAVKPPSALEAWDDLFRLLDQTLGGINVLSVETHAPETGHVICAPGLADRTTFQAVHTPWTRALRRTSRPSVVTDVEARAIVQAPLTATPFYRDHMKPLRLHHCIASDVGRDAVAMMVLSTFFPLETPPTEKHIHLHTAIQPHLRRAIEFLRQEHTSQARVDAAECALTGPTTSIFLTQQQTRRVIHMNKAASRMSTSGHGLFLDSEERLTASDPSVTQRLRKLIAASDRTTEHVMRLSRRDGHPDLHLLVGPAQDNQAMFQTSPTVTVFVTDPAYTPPLSFSRLRSLHGLTAAEARVAAALAQGESIHKTAQHLGTAEATARHHLKQVFAKTGTHRQAELVRLILGDPLMHDRLISDDA